MKAMILAAGLGTRLQPLTNDCPKALVTVGGRTLLEIAVTRLRGFGVREVIVNVHHFAERIAEYLGAQGNFGVRIEISREDALLDTGGGLKKAGYFFLGSDGGSQEPFIVHNVDVISSIDLGSMMRFHNDHGGLATLAVQDRETSRYLLFDEQGQLCGRRGGRDGKAEMARSCNHAQARAFAGIHVISPQLLLKMGEDDVFSIINTYLDLAGQGERIVAFPVDDRYWRDLGRPESLAQAAVDLANGKWSIQN
jgi:NDP-sugar pyrophosphorylase family protein